MKIIKRGTPRSERVFIMNCNNCGTTFEIKYSEGRVVYDQRDGDYIKCGCPVCQSDVTHAL